MQQTLSVLKSSKTTRITKPMTTTSHLRVLTIRTLHLITRTITAAALDRANSSRLLCILSEIVLRSRRIRRSNR